MEITEKVAYLKGLMEGMKLDTESNEGKILSAMADILEDISLELEDLWDSQTELEDGLDVVSDDLEDVEMCIRDRNTTPWMCATSSFSPRAAPCPLMTRAMMPSRRS